MPAEGLNKKQMTALSIIVPVYNVEKYLAKCLDSVLQTVWNIVSYEIIVVNDASPDGSLAIAETYANDHPQIRIISQPNKGLGGARNTGLQAARGEYVFFLDSDDFLVNDHMPVLVQKALQQQVDILEFRAVTVREDYSEIQNIFQVEEISPVSGLEYYGTHNPSNSVCNKLYKRIFLLGNEILFMEKVYVEDAPFNVEAYIKAKTVASHPLTPVAFLQNTTSITRQKRTGEQMDKFITDSIKVTSQMASFLSDDMPLATQKALKRKLAIFVSGILLMIIKSDNKFSDYLAKLQRENLYPMRYRSGIFVRDFFLMVANQPLFFEIVKRFKNFLK